MLNDARVDSLFSDHHAILCTLQVSKPPPQKECVKYRKLNDIDFKKFNEDLSTSLNAYSSLDLNEKVSYYFKSAASALDKHAPEKTKEFVPREVIPWMDENILNAKRHRRKLERKWRVSGLTVHKEMYLHQKSIVNRMCDNAKRNYYKDKIENCDQSKLFQLANSLLHGKETKSLPHHEEKSILVNQFNDFFVDKIVQIRSKLDSARQSSPHSSSTPPTNITTMTEFQLPSLEKSSKLIKSASSATCALDPIPTKLVKSHCLTALLPIIHDIITGSLQSGEFPADFKIANVCPLLKKPSLDKDVLKNYRPVSNLAFVSKVIEKIVATQLNDHLLSNNLMEEFQSAYRKGHSTETALLRVQSDILQAIDRGNAAYLILLDLSAAFDTIDHETLLSFMNTHLGIEGKALQWFSSYLQCRKQSVVINGVASQPSILKYGVPQGSVLGPILFCIYMLPLSAVIKKHNMALHIYADDTQIYCFFNPKSPTDAGNALSILTRCIDDVRAWMNQALLKLNEDKTEFLVISSPYHQENLRNTSITVGDAVITSATQCRNLGVIFDAKLDMKPHVAAVCRSAFFQLRKIGSIRKYLTDEACATLINSFVISRVDYCNSLLANLPKCVLAKLQKVQNVAARILTRIRVFDNIAPVLIDIHWLPISLRIRYKINLLTFKSLHGLGSPYLNSLLFPYQPAANLRSANKDLLTEHRYKLKTYGHRAYFIVAPSFWNSLPAHLRSENDFAAFKSGLKSYLFKLFVQDSALYVF